jgi:hypothetical protein
MEKLSARIVALIKKKKIDTSIVEKSINYFTQRKKDNELIEETIQRVLSGKVHIGPKRLLSIFGLTKQDLIEKSQPLKLGKFNVFGCNLSRDIDVACVVNKRKDIKKYIDIDQLKQELKLLDYDITRDIDVNLVYIENGNIQVVSKGSKETQNIIYSTYKLHKQAYACLVNTEIEVNLIDKINMISKYILNYMEILIGKDDYAIERKNKSDVYAGGWMRVEYSMNIMKKIKLFDNIQWKDAMKSLVMKLIQLILLDNSQTEYRKYDMAMKYDKLYPGQGVSVLWFLTRGTQGEQDMKCLDTLLSEYARICLEEKNELEWKEFKINNSTNPTILPDTIMKEFFSSPIVPNDEFKKIFSKCAGSFKSINEMFPIKCIGVDKLPKYIIDKAILVTQRSEEWLKLLTYYTCGKNTGMIEYKGDDWVAFYFNLIRGALMETMIIHTVDYSHIITDPIIAKATVGLLVTDKKEKSFGAAPDLIIVLDDEIVPVEIKCLDGKPSCNKDYRRAIKLAKIQLRSVANIVGKIKRGIITLVHIYNDIDGNPVIIGRSALIEI